jgi:hypothetical protein
MKARATVLNVCYARASANARGLVDVLRAMRKATRVAELVMQWALATDELGREVASVEELVDVWQGTLSRATIWRRVGEFRELFPEHETPQPLADALLAAARQRGEQVSAPTLMRTPVAIT